MAADRHNSPLGGDEWIAVALIGAVVLALGVWCGAQVSTLVTTGGWLDASIGDAVGAMVRLPGHGSYPADAWPATIRADIAGPTVYWLVTALVVGGQIGAVSWLWLRLGSGRIGTRRRRRLGVEVGARLATRRDLAPLVVDGPTPGRFILGTVNRRLVATENRAALQQRRARGDRQGDRSAVAVIGPTRSGKTATVVAGILDWDGPAILSSVQNDLFDATVQRRAQLGDVYLFDPMRTIPDPLPEGVKRCGWSPLHSARTVSGAMEAANLLMEAAPSEGVTNANYWSRKGEALLWPMLFAAAIANRTMADVVRWLALQDGNPPDPQPTSRRGTAAPVDPALQRGEIRGLLDAAAMDPDRRVAIQAEHALAQFDGFWNLDHRTRSDIYSTSQTLVQPWEDPNVSFASSPDAGPVADLRHLLAGRNTLYVVQPLKSTQRFSVVFGGLLGALLKDQAYEVAKRYRRPLPDLLCVIDEAGNTPLRWLPEVASTCAGIGVLLVTVWQSKAQIDAIYQAQAGPVLTNHGSKVIFAGVSDVETLEYVSYLAGEEEIAQRSSNADAHLAGYRRGVADSTIHRRLLPAEVLRQAKPGQALLLHGTLPPAHLIGRRAWLDPRLRALAAGDGPKPIEVKSAPELLAALAFDPTPPLDVLKHLPGILTARCRCGPRC
ncbi:MAG: type IV secretory system conjugative DNA transfer family protein [Ilumatobacteraceae bacterium]